jgi:DNA-binding NtrC family response regulator
LNRREETDKRFSPAALRSLAAYHWPGNVRELKNVVERSFIVAGETIEVGSLSAELTAEAPPAGPYLRLPVGSSLAELERRLILATVERFDGDKKAAAAALGICLKTLYNRLNSYRPAAG